MNLIDVEPIKELLRLSEAFNSAVIAMKNSGFEYFMDEPQIAPARAVADGDAPHEKDPARVAAANKAWVTMRAPGYVPPTDR